MDIFTETFSPVIGPVTGTPLTQNDSPLPAVVDPTSPIIAPLPPPPSSTMLPGEGEDIGPAQILTPRPRVALRALAPIALDNATGSDGVEYQITGNWLEIGYSTNATDVIFIRVGDQSDFVPATRGYFIAGIAFDRIWVRIDTAVAGAKLYISYCHDPEVGGVRKE